MECVSHFHCLPFCFPPPLCLELGSLGCFLWRPVCKFVLMCLLVGFFLVVTCAAAAVDCRRDSFITHRAFCDALAEESARATAANPLANHHPILFPQPAASHEPSPLQQTILHGQFPQLARATEANAGNIDGHGIQQELSLKREHQHQHFNLRSDMPPWLACQAPTSLAHLDLPSSVCSTRLERGCSPENPAPHPPLPRAFQAPASSPHMSATALLQKAAEMGATMSRPPHLGQMATHTANAVAVPNGASGFGLGLSSHQYMSGGSFGNVSPPPSLLQDMVMNSLTSTLGFDGSFDDAFGGMLGSEREPGKSNMESSTRRHGMAEETGGVGGGNDGKTRDFLGLKAFPHGNILNLTALDPCMSSTPYEHHQQREEEAKESLTPSTGRLLFPSFPSFCHLDLGARGGGRGGGSVEDAEAAREHSSSRAVITRREVGETVSTTPIPTLSYLTAPRFLVTFASFSSPRLRFLSVRL
ncbi:hypothetical protein GW17_00051622 [Ensete ventricosum]|nr:hypothetical protein GW17_00051622 [Ensete ventricosum]